MADRPVEFVERKGIGHPDSLCDGVAEAVSRALSRRYREAVGRVCHHNTDKVQLVAGESSPAFGGGTVDAPMYLLVGGRATAAVDGHRIPVEEVAVEAAREYLAETVPELPASAVEVAARIGETSTDLRSLTGAGPPRANDTSFGVGYAPLTPLERTVRSLKPRVHGELDAVGKDVKVMGVRTPAGVEFTVAAAVLAGRVDSREAYREVVARVRELVVEHARDRLDAPVEVSVNAADAPGSDDVYLTETGLSAELADDGAVGRGNRANGLITPHRPMSLEAVAGKNPVGHVGKLYNLVGPRVAETLVDAGAEYAAVELVSRIGRPVADPRAADVTVAGDVTEGDVERALGAELDGVSDLTDALVRGEVPTF